MTPTPSKPMVNKSRRRFLILSTLGGGGLALGFYIGIGGERARRGRELWEDEPEDFAPNAWLRIDRAGNVTVRVNHTELGQGVTTGLPTILADELDADWNRVRFEIAPVEPVYRNPMMGSYATGGSTSTPGSWEPLRQAGATARAMLVQAAALSWGVSPESCQTEKGTVLHPASDRRASYGDLVDAAAALDVPSDVRLKDPKEFRLIGTDVPRLDIEDKVAGRTQFAIDVQLPGMLTATVVHPPVFGERAARVNAEKTRGLAGVREVIEFDTGVAVVAETYWQAAQGAAALDIEWDGRGDHSLSSASLWQRWSALLDAPEAKELEVSGDAAGAIATAAKTVEAEYRVPYQAHACKEPLACVAQVADGRCRIWTGTQGQDGTQETAAKITGIGYYDIEVTTTFAGGGFGRRSNNPEVKEAVALAHRLGVPVKVIWSREEDTQHDDYRPASLHRLRAGLDSGGRLVGWSHRIVGQDPIATLIPQLVVGGAPFWMPSGMRNLMGDTAASLLPSVLSGLGVKGGAGPLPYAIANFRLDYVEDQPPVPVGMWRGVGYSANPFVVESFLDEVAIAAGRDPLDLRRELLADNPLPLAALERAAKAAGWGEPLPAGRHRGVALADYEGAWVPTVAEISVVGNEIRVHRLVSAVDCGRVINPGNVRRQISGGLIFGLSATLGGEITLAGGRVEQSNFNDFPIIAFADAPAIEVHLMPSEESPRGIGEAGVPPIAAAVANALFAATGERQRRLPLRLS